MQTQQVDFLTAAKITEATLIHLEEWYKQRGTASSVGPTIFTLRECRNLLVKRWEWEKNKLPPKPSESGIMKAVAFFEEQRAKGIMTDPDQYRLDRQINNLKKD